MTPPAAAASLTQGGRFAWHEGPHAALAAALGRLCPRDERVAVRSSAADEDGGRASFAGQLASFLFVAPDAVAAHVALVWRSAHAAHVRAYRERHGLGRAPGANVPVLVQRMVDADAAGVAFSADPVSGRRGIAVVAAVPGVANALVAGERDGDTWHVDRSGRVTARTTEGRLPCLRDAQALAVADLARRCARHFGAPQDIEWAYEGAKLWLLQSRPITSLAARPDPDAALALFDSSNIGESYGGTTTPLTYSFIRRAYEHVYRELCRVGGAGEAVVEDHSPALRRMVTPSGVLIAPITTVYYDTGFLIGLKGFVGAIIGRLVSYPLAAIRAVLVGLLEPYSSFWASAYKEVIVFTLIIPVLLWRSLTTHHVEEEE